ncbi:MAG: methylamine utilization protein, partial [Pseudomonadota bacterium]|nr:methylamine utilization protein [Pseudomonadota bacterium]
VLVVPVDSSVEFPNRDNTQHHVYSFSPAKTFNIELYAGRPEAPIVFDKPGIVELGCNIHDHMQGFVVVSDTPTVGKTNDDGQVTLSLGPQQTGNIPERIQLQIWHPRLPDNTEPVTREVATSEPATVSLSLVPEPPAESSLDLLQQRFREL